MKLATFMANPTTNWERCGDRYYRKVKLYDAVFDEDLELENYVLASAPYAGAIGTSTTPDSANGC